MMRRFTDTRSMRRLNVVGKEVGEDGGLRVHVPLTQKRSQALEQRLVGLAKQPCRRFRNTVGHREIVPRRSRRVTLMGRAAPIDTVYHQRHYADGRVAFDADRAADSRADQSAHDCGSAHSHIKSPCSASGLNNDLTASDWRSSDMSIAP
jgi:hypothetical protein